MTSAQIILALRGLYAPPEWITAEEFQCEPGYQNKQCRIDFLAFNSWPSKEHEIHGIEIKVSRSDFLSEIKNPEKRKRNVELCDYFFFATPSGLIKPMELPADCGWITITDDSEKRPEILMWPKIEKEKAKLLPRSFVAGITRNFSDRYDAYDIRCEIRKAKQDLIYELRCNR